MAVYTLGLDIGVGSIGWAMLEGAPDAEYTGLLNSGSRVFPEGVARDTKGLEKSKMTDRREARLMRRQHDRKARRKETLCRRLQRHGLLPAASDELARGMEVDPWRLRKQGLNERLAPSEFGRVLIHLNQRRGFKSNARDAHSAKAKEQGVVKETAARLSEAMSAAGARTLGEYLAGVSGKEPLRNRALTATDFPRYTLRAMYEQEFDRLWVAQSFHHPQLMTEALRVELRESIFHQRPLKSADDKIGFCELERTERRCLRASWHAQQFRLIQDLNHMMIDPVGPEPWRPLTAEEHATLLEELQHSDSMTIAAVRKLLGLNKDDKLSFEKEKNSKLLGNAAEAALREMFGNDVDARPEHYRGDVWTSAIGDDEDTFRAKATAWKLSAEQADQLLAYAAKLPDGHASQSRKAIEKLLPVMTHTRLSYAEAKLAAGYAETQPDIHDELPPAPTDLANPIVRQALIELRRVVNALIEAYGKPSHIVVELARDTKGTSTERNDRLADNRKRQREREDIEKELLTGGVHPTSLQILKHRLWKECGETCPFTHRRITWDNLFGKGGEVQVEHILPYSRSLDDGYMNKTLCFQDENARKGNRMPREAYAESDPARWDKMLTHLDGLVAKHHFPPAKVRKFKQLAIDTDGCIDRQLNDTRYISRKAREYLMNLYGAEGKSRVRVTRGQVTALLRHMWGLNTILSPDGRPHKNRDDHRHHAIDAVVVALTTQKYLKRLSERKDFDPKHGVKFDPPWGGDSGAFRRAVEESIERILVSHRPLRHIRGALHKETSYGATRTSGTYVYRKAVGTLTAAAIGEIVDPRIRQIIQEHVAAHGGDPKKALAQPVFLPNKNGPPIPVRKVRIIATQGNFIPLWRIDPHTGQREAKPYRWVEPGSNHHIATFEYADKKGRPKRDGIVVTMFEAAQRGAENGRRRKKGRPDIPIVRRAPLPEEAAALAAWEALDDDARRDTPCPLLPAQRDLVELFCHHPDAWFVMSLCANEMVRASGPDGIEALWRVQKFDVNGVIVLRPSVYAGKVSDLDAYPLVLRCKPNTLSGGKVRIDPIGREWPASD